MADVMDALYTNGDKTVITDELKNQLDDYYAQWGAK
jgi:orotate phosphoribosyltransferase